MSADSAARKAELEAMEMTWDGEIRIVSEYFIQLMLIYAYFMQFWFFCN